MRKTKTQKGITLVALIITIVVLLILAVVAITAIQDEDLIGKVNSAATTYNQSVNNESTQLGNYANIIDGYLSNITAGGNGGQTGGSIVWTQSGTTITSSNGSPVTVGDTITNYNAGGLTWKILGVENGKLLITSLERTGEVFIQPQICNQSDDGGTSLDEKCAALNLKIDTYAESVRSISESDITRLGNLTSGTNAYNLIYSAEVVEDMYGGDCGGYWINGHGVTSAVYGGTGACEIPCMLSTGLNVSTWEYYDEHDTEYGVSIQRWDCKLKPVVVLKDTVTLTGGSGSWTLN